LSLDLSRGMVLEEEEDNLKNVCAFFFISYAIKGHHGNKKVTCGHTALPGKGTFDYAFHVARHCHGIGFHDYKR
jgi:hypothetical protein